MSGAAPTDWWEQHMERLYYVECEHETAETSDRLEAARIAAEWARRGYKVDTIAVDLSNGQVELADSSKEPGTTHQVRSSAAHDVTLLAQ